MPSRRRVRTAISDPGGRVLDGVVDEVRQDLQDEPRVDARHEQVVLLLHAQVVRAAVLLQALHGAAHDLAQELRLQVQGHAPLLHAGDGEQVFHGA